MEKNNWIFLTKDEVLDAIAIDFQQYGPQPLIFRELAPLILNSRCKITPGKKDTGIWIQLGQDYPFQKIDDKDLGFYFSHILETTKFSLKMIARICAIVFQTRVCPGMSQEKGLQGVWIKNHMNGFACRRCGHCCTSLGYDNDCTKEDYLKWQTLGRRDILDRVMIVHKSRADIQYRIWLDLDTGAIAQTCPWLKLNPQEQGFDCLIQDIKPAVCQNYPFTSKHAVMTGCRGEFPPFLRTNGRSILKTRMGERSNTTNQPSISSWNFIGKILKCGFYCPATSI